MATAEPNSPNITTSDQLRRLLYINSYHGTYVTGNPDKHFERYSHNSSLLWAKSNPKEFISLLEMTNLDHFVPRRYNIFYLIAQALASDITPAELKLDLRELVLHFVKDDDEFFYFLKYYSAERKSRQRISNSVKKIVLKFYQQKTPESLALSVATTPSRHSWSHKDLFKLIHYKCEVPEKVQIINYVLFGKEKLNDVQEPNAEILRKHHELRTSEDVSKVVALVKELHASIEQVNLKLGKNEEVWTAVIQEIPLRDILRYLYKFYKYGFLKTGSIFQSKLIEAINDPVRIKQSDLHPLEVFIYLKVFEKGGKVVDPKFVEYLKLKNVKPETVKRITTVIEPKNQHIIQNVNKCLKMTYNNVQPLNKRIMITVDATEKTESVCFHNKRISCYEAMFAFCKFFSKVEKNVIFAIFKDNQINLVEINKCFSAQKMIEKLEENKASYILPHAPIDWAATKKKPVDLFINFMSCNWQQSQPTEIKNKNEKVSDHLTKYSKKLKLPNTKVIKIFLEGRTGPTMEPSKHIISICGFSVDVPKIVEAFSRDKF